jgi:hypothetical protein
MTSTGERSPSMLELANEILWWIRSKTSNVPVLHTHKSFVARALCRGAFDHFNAICYLTAAGANSSAHALLRVQWESLIRGLWIYLACPEQDVELYWSGRRRIPGLQQAIKAVEKGILRRAIKQGLPSPKHWVLTDLQVAIGNLMHELTHMGARQMQAYTRGASEIAPNFESEAVDSMLMFSTRIALYTVASFSWITENETLDNEAMAKYLDFQRRITWLGNVNVRDALG